MASRRRPLPSFEELPLNPGNPPNSAWGLWEDEKGSSLGSLNYLTDELVLKTVREEIKTGERTSLEYFSLIAINVMLDTKFRQSPARLLQATLTGKSWS